MDNIKKIGLVLLMLPFAISGIVAQKKVSENKFGPINSHFEATANVTTVIARFSGNLNKAIEEDPYLIAGKYYFASIRTAVRLGINGGYEKENKSTNNGTLETKDYFFYPTLGFEFRRVVHPRFEIYGGIDFRKYSKFSNTVSSDQIGTTSITSTTTGYGAGPVFGFTFFMTKRIKIFTESNLYLNKFWIDRNMVSNGFNSHLESTEKYNLMPVVPSSLFLTINF